MVEWWAKRRLLYNLWAFVLAIVGFGLFLAVTALPGVLGPGDDAIEPIGLVCGAVVMPLAWNLCFSLGVPAERWLSARWPGRAWAPVLFGAGVALTGAFFAVPFVVVGISWLVRR